MLALKNIGKNPKGITWDTSRIFLASLCISEFFFSKCPMLKLSHIKFNLYTPLVNTYICNRWNRLVTILPSLVKQLAPDHLRGRHNAADTNAWQISLVIGPTLAGTLLGVGAHWLWLNGLIIGLMILSVIASRLKLPDRPIAK